LNIFESFNLNAFWDEDGVYTIAMVQDVKKASALKSVSSMSAIYLLTRLMK